MPFGFDCPNCGDTTVIESDDPDEVVNNIYECEGCGENILMENYVGDREASEA